MSGPNKQLKPVVLTLLLLCGLLSGCATTGDSINLANMMEIKAPFFKEQILKVAGGNDLATGYNLVYQGPRHTKRLTYVSNQNNPPKSFQYRFYGENIVYTHLITTTTQGKTFTLERLMLCTPNGKRVTIEKNLLDFKFVGPTDGGILCRYPKSGVDREDILFSAKQLASYK